MKNLFVSLIVGLLMLPTVACAQQLPQFELNLKVTTQEAETIWKALRKLPVEEVETLMLKLRTQVVDQTTPKQPVPEPKPDK